MSHRLFCSPNCRKCSYQFNTRNPQEIAKTMNQAARASGEIGISQTWHNAVFWYGVSALPKLRALSPNDRMKVMLEASEFSLQDPLWLHPKRDLVVKSWSERPLSGGQVTALIVFGLWVQVGEREEMCPQLIEDWPEIRLALVFAPREEKN